MRKKGTGHIKERKNGRFTARVMGFNVGTHDTKEKAQQAITDFTGNKCPYCRREFE